MHFECVDLLNKVADNIERMTTLASRYRFFSCFGKKKRLLLGLWKDY